MKKETYEKVVKLLRYMSEHRYCEDGFYACPKNEEYFGNYSNTPIEQRPCDCGADEARDVLGEMGIEL